MNLFIRIRVTCVNWFMISMGANHAFCSPGLILVPRGTSLKVKAHPYANRNLSRPTHMYRTLSQPFLRA